MIYAKKHNYQKMVKNIDNNTLKSYNKRFCAKFKISALMNAITLKKVSDIQKVQKIMKYQITRLVEYDIIEEVSNRKLLFIFPINDLDSRIDFLSVKISKL